MLDPAILWDLVISPGSVLTLILFAAGRTINEQRNACKLYEFRSTVDRRPTTSTVSGRVMNILVTRNLPSSVMARLHELGSVDLYTEGAIPPDVLKQRVADKDAVVCLMSDEIDRRVIDAGTRLKIVSERRRRVQQHRRTPTPARAASIVTNTPEVLTESVADFTWAMILAITRRLAEGDRLIRRDGWKEWAFDFMLGTELRGQAARAGRFRPDRARRRRARTGVRHARRLRRRDGARTARSRSMSLDRLLNTSDVVSLHVTLTPETRHLIDKKALARMKRSAYLVNTSRGPVVDEEALVMGAPGAADCRRRARCLRERARRPPRPARRSRT